METDISLDQIVDLRLATNDKPIDDLSSIRHLIRAFAQESERRPFITWSPPDSVNDISDDEVTDALLRASRIEGHYRAIERKLSPMIEHFNKSLTGLLLWLQQNEYDNLSSLQQQKDAALLCPEYLAAREVLYSLKRVASFVEGERGRWGDIYQGISRAIEIRKAKAVPGGRDSSEPKTPGRVPRDHRGATKKPYTGRR
ncbi:MAG: hypothetical protein KDB07_06230 [Planctomycetes bacterium]|nr:hypothetical protein [Planctomycetota bacterium]